MESPRDYTTDDLYVLTVANKYTAGLKDLELTLQHFGYNYRIHGIGREWHGFRSKLQWYTEILAELPDTAIVVAVDAYDVLMVAPPEELLNKWKESPRPILIGAEDDCVDNSVCHRPYNAWTHSGKPRHMPFVNSGVIMGPVKLMRWLYTLALNGPDSDDDQRAMGHIMDIYPGLFKMDSDQYVIGNMRYPVFHRYEWSNQRNRIVYYGSDIVTSPSIIHTVGLWWDGTYRHMWVGKAILGDKYVEHSWKTVWKGIYGRSRLAIRRKPSLVVLSVIYGILFYLFPRGILIATPLILAIVYIVSRH